MPPQPEVVRAWLRILRDLVTVFIAALILIHETIATKDPNATLIAAGLVLLGLPPALRIDEWLRKPPDKEDG